jgi:hypothetical protein
MNNHRYRYSFKKWINRKRKWDPVEHEKKGQKYYDIFPSLYYTNQTYGALNKCWLGFTIAKVKNEYDKIKIYVRRIQKLEKHLGRAVTDFSNLEDRIVRCMISQNKLMDIHI